MTAERRAQGTMSVREAARRLQVTEYKVRAMLERRELRGVPAVIGGREVVQVSAASVAKRQKAA